MNENDNSIQNVKNSNHEDNEQVTQATGETSYTPDFVMQEPSQAANSENIKKERNPMNPKIKKILFVVLAAVLFGVIAGSIGALANSLVSKISNANIKIESTQSGLTKGDPNASTATVENIVEQCMPSVVSISNKSVTEVMTFFGVLQKENAGSGSGIIIGKNDSELLIVTNYHVVADSTELSVMLSDTIPVQTNEQSTIKEEEILKAKVKGYDSDKDLAVIAINLNDISAEQLAKIKVATIGDSSTLNPGQQVVAIGNALGYGQSVTVGYISATNRELTLNGQTQPNNEVKNTFIQTDAAINPGNSGGALLNMKGELIGINSVKIAASGVEGMGYAIPISDVEDIIGSLMTVETREAVEESDQGLLGVMIKDVTADMTGYGMPQGVYVDSVDEGSAAEKAGIKKGYIITKFDNYPVKTGTQLKERLTYYKAGETKTITVQVPSEDGYKEKELKIKLDEKKEEKNNQ